MTVNSAMEQVHIAGDIYQIGRTARLEGIRQGIADTKLEIRNDQFTVRRDGFLSELDGVMRETATRLDKTEAKQRFEKFEPGSAFYFLESKPEYFDSDIVADMKSCSSQTKELDVWRACMRGSSANVLAGAKKQIHVQKPNRQIDDVDNNILSDDVENNALSNDVLSQLLRDPRLARQLRARPELFGGLSRSGGLHLKRDGTKPDVRQPEPEEILDAARIMNAVTPLREYETSSVPEYGIVSGVREMPWRLDRGLDFARPGTFKTSDAPPPLGQGSQLQFFMQVVFQSPPYFRADVERWWTQGDKPVLNAAKDELPWRFPNISERVVSAVATVKNDPVRRDEFEPVEELLIAQRLFRAALARELGKQFPLQKLANLTWVTANAVKDTVTPRWQTKPGWTELGFFKYLAQSVDTKATSSSVAKKIEACFALAGPVKQYLRSESLTESELDSNKKDMLQLARISSDDWSSSCVFSPEDLKELPNGSDISKVSVRVKGRRALRIRAGIAAEDDSDRLGPGGKAVCGPM